VKVNKRKATLNPYYDVYDHAGRTCDAIRGFTRLPYETWNIWKEQVVVAVQGMVEETNGS
jgi:hypothetical protein